MARTPQRPYRRAAVERLLQVSGGSESRMAELLLAEDPSPASILLASYHYAALPAAEQAGSAAAITGPDSAEDSLQLPAKITGVIH